MSTSDQALQLDHLSWVQAARHLARDPRLIIPVGALEQHGEHLPLGTNALITRRIARDLSRAADVLCAPTLCYGVNVSTERLYVGNASLRPKTLHRVLNDLLACWEPQGVNEFVIITAHRHEPHLDALATLVTEGARVRVVSIWDVPVADLLETQSGPMHGGEAETSVMLYLYPERVQLERGTAAVAVPAPAAAKPTESPPAPPTGEPATGTTGHPTAATREKGVAIYTRLLDTILRAVFRPGGADEEDTDTL